VPWSGGGNRVADVVHEIKRGFAEDNHEVKLAGSDVKPRAVIFCGSVGQVKAITTALEDKDVPALSWTGESPERVPGHNGPLDAFLAHGSAGDPKGPRVLVTTSLLSRGLDFSADVTAIYLVDPPRDVLDFVHRAGRAGRAGRHGRVVVFGVNGANDLRYGKEIKSVLGKVERRVAVKPGGRTFSGKGDDRKRR
jgi:ATP-dependent RNA helicase MRH4